MNTFHITEQLSTVFPDIQGQLCSKHTVLLNQIQKKYQHIYPLHQSSHFVVVKQIATLVKGQEMSVSMAMEQGVTLVLSQGQEDQFINVSSNHFSEIVLERSGKIINQESQIEFSKVVKKGIQAAVDDLSLNKMKGGFIYLHFPSHENLYKMKEAILIGIFLGVMVLNGILGEYSVEELVKKLQYLQQFKNNALIEDYFYNFKNRQLVVKSSTSTYQNNLNSKYKLLFFDMTFLQEDFKGIFLSNSQNDQLITKVLEQKIDFVQLIGQLSQNQISQIGNQEIIEFISQIHSRFKIKGFIFNERYCIMPVQKYRYAEVIGKISRMIHKIQSQESPQSNDHLTPRHSSSKIQQILFSSTPSPGVSIIDPSDCIQLS